MLRARLELPGHLLKNTIDCFAGESVPLVPTEVLLVYYEIVVRIEFPKTAIQDVEVLVAEELPYLVDVIFFGDCHQHVEQVRILEIPVGNLAVIIHIEAEEDSHDHGVGVAVLELGSRLQEL